MSLSIQQYEEILGSELLPALGCTEPIAIALCGALAREQLGGMPEEVTVRCSGNIIKNVDAVIVPQSGGRKGIAFAVALGIFGGDASLGLQVLQTVRDEHIARAEAFIQEGKVRIEHEQTSEALYIACDVRNSEHSATVVISNTHTNVSLIIKDEQVLHREEETDFDPASDEIKALKRRLRFEEIWKIAEAPEITAPGKIREILEEQINCNRAISREGLMNNWGQQVGKTLLKHEKPSLEAQMVGGAAAGSDARMAGCSMPVVINSGSGNQGMTVSVPLIVMAEELDLPEDKLLRALFVSNLIAIHQKSGIGNLSAYCGAVSAAAAAAAGICYLKDHSMETAQHSVSNALAISSGMVCDGAKASCAGKIAVSLKTALLGIEMAENDLYFPKGEGIIGQDIEHSIRNVGRLAKEGMHKTDHEILQIMIED